jgi:hypothetical protein
MGLCAWIYFLGLAFNLRWTSCSEGRLSRNRFIVRPETRGKEMLLLLPKRESGEAGDSAMKVKLPVPIHTSVDGGVRQPNRGGESNVLVVEVESSDSDRLRLRYIVTGGEAGGYLME